MADFKAGIDGLDKAKIAGTLGTHANKDSFPHLADLVSDDVLNQKQPSPGPRTCGPRR